MKPADSNSVCYWTGAYELCSPAEIVGWNPTGGMDVRLL